MSDWTITSTGDRFHCCRRGNVHDACMPVVVENLLRVSDGANERRLNAE